MRELPWSGVRPLFAGADACDAMRDGEMALLVCAFVSRRVDGRV